MEAKVGMTVIESISVVLNHQEYVSPRKLTQKTRPSNITEQGGRARVAFSPALSPASHHRLKDLARHELS